MLGNRCSVTFMGNGSISLAQSVLIPYRSDARGEAANAVKQASHSQGAHFVTAAAIVRVVLTAAWAV